MNRYTLAFVFLIFSISFSQAQKTPEPLIEAFFSDFILKNSEVALTNLYNTNPWIEQSSEAVLSTKLQLARADTKLLGTYLGYEQIQSKKVTKDYHIYSYFVKFDRQLLRFTFAFYRPSDEWRLYAFEFDDTYDEELKESMRLYYVRFK